MIPALSDFLVELAPVTNPGSRIYLGSLAVSAITALIYLMIKKQHNLNIKDYWFSPSALVDYKIFLINGLLKIFIFTPVLGLSYLFSKYTIKFLYLLAGDFGMIDGNLIYFFAATLFAFIFDDFLRFYHHYLMHKIPALWALHKTHHSADVLTPMTLFRIHPLESAMSTLRNSLSYGVTAGLFMYLFSGKVELITLLGVNAFGFLFNFTFGNLRHSHVEVSFGWLEKLLISPKQHQIHHSNKLEHHDKNFGVALSIWDQIFATFLYSEDQTVEEFGLDDLPAEKLLQQFF